jgi:LuxR family maltose regulon positive regulatory protein
MNASLPATKFYIPTPRSDLVPRPRLTCMLSEGLAAPLILISAPAGFGKTTLLAEWHASPSGRTFPLAWLSLEAEDNDLARFLTCLGSALESLRPGMLAEAETALQSSPPLQPKSVLEALLHHLNSGLSSIPGPFALVLEDYHSITAGAIHDTVAYLIGHLPPQMHVILSSRADPPLPLSRLRVRGNLAEIRTDDLRFTREETGTYLNQVMKLALGAEDIDTLEARTEGWIAGLKLAALSMQGDPHADFSAFISEFAGRHHYIADYLVEEVLNGQPGEVRDFLLQTSALPILCGALCDAALRQGNSQAMLERLDQENLFIVRLDDDRTWYRYHHLFADLLRHRLNQAYPGLAAELHRRAAEWFEQNGWLDCAVEEALEAQRFELAASWIERLHPSMAENGQAETLSRWLQALPDGVLQAHPPLAALRSSRSRGILTPRELEVLRLIGRGASNREIARTLIVSTGTVKKHLNNIFGKLEAQNRAHAVARGRDLGLL